MIIGITGRAGSGKSTVARYLEEHFYYTSVSFSAPIHSFVLEMLDWEHEKEVLVEVPPKLKNTPLTKLFGKTPREIMQSLGTEWGRKTIHPDFWLAKAQREVESLIRLGTTNIVISDVRFENEAAWVRKIGKLVYVFKNDVPELDHESERGIHRLKGDSILLNNGSYDFLYQQINCLFQ